MRKKITVFIFFLLIGLMPFVDFSCSHGKGYSIGFPIVILSFFIEPFFLEKFYPLGFIDIALALIAFLLYKTAETKQAKIRDIHLIGINSFFCYAAAHFLLNLLLPVIDTFVSPTCSSSAMMNIVGYIIFPYALLSNNISMFNIDSFIILLRINFVFASMIYFLAGVQVARVLKLIKKANAWPGPKKN
ncbi:MAG: hypothetical protein V2A72_03260 [Candidatus Omnitrophota bacterium]